jgi:hypothetical protein
MLPQTLLLNSGTQTECYHRHYSLTLEHGTEGMLPQTLLLNSGTQDRGNVTTDTTP